MERPRAYKPNVPRTIIMPAPLIRFFPRDTRVVAYAWVRWLLVGGRVALLEGGRTFLLVFLEQAHTLTVSRATRYASSHLIFVLLMFLAQPLHSGRMQANCGPP